MRSSSGGVLDHLQTVGVSALEDRQARALLNRAVRRELVEAGHSSASLPWDLHPVSAKPRPGGGDSEGQGYVEPSFHDEATRAFVSRRFRGMNAAGGAVHVRVIECYFGELGTRYAETPLPRAFSLLHVVPSGRRLLEQAQSLLRAPGLRALPAPDRMRHHCRTWDDVLYAQHNELRAAAQLEADRAFAAAAMAWNQARAGR
jgi:hypothetical protein